MFGSNVTLQVCCQPSCILAHTTLMGPCRPVCQRVSPQVGYMFTRIVAQTTHMLLHITVSLTPETCTGCAGELTDITFIGSLTRVWIRMCFFRVPACFAEYSQNSYTCVPVHRCELFCVARDSSWSHR